MREKPPTREAAAGWVLLGAQLFHRAAGPCGPGDAVGAPVPCWSRVPSSHQPQLPQGEQPLPHALQALLQGSGQLGLWQETAERACAGLPCRGTLTADLTVASGASAAQAGVGTRGAGGGSRRVSIREGREGRM